MPCMIGNLKLLRDQIRRSVTGPQGCLITHISFSMQFAASFLGENVKTMRPTIHLKYFHPNPPKIII